MTHHRRCRLNFLTRARAERGPLRSKRSPSAPGPTAPTHGGPGLQALACLAKGESRGLILRADIFPCRSLRRPRTTYRSVSRNEVRETGSHHRWRAGERTGDLPQRSGYCPGGGIGRHAGLRSLCLNSMGVRVPPWAPNFFPSRKEICPAEAKRRRTLQLKTTLLPKRQIAATLPDQACFDSVGRDILLSGRYRIHKHARRTRLNLY